MHLIDTHLRGRGFLKARGKSYPAFLGFVNYSMCSCQCVQWLISLCSNLLLTLLHFSNTCTRRKKRRPVLRRTRRVLMQFWFSVLVHEPEMFHVKFRFMISFLWLRLRCVAFHCIQHIIKRISFILSGQCSGCKLVLLTVAVVWPALDCFNSRNPRIMALRNSLPIFFWLSCLVYKARYCFCFCSCIISMIHAMQTGRQLYCAFAFEGIAYVHCWM